MFNYHESFFVEKMLKKVMEKAVIGFFIFIMVIGLGCAEGSWDSFEEGGESEVLDISKDISDDREVASSGVPSEEGNVDNVIIDYGNRKGSTVYTPEFYIALGVGGVGLLIIIFFIYLFLRRPENKFRFKGVPVKPKISKNPKRPLMVLKKSFPKK